MPLVGESGCRCCRVLISQHCSKFMAWRVSCCEQSQPRFLGWDCPPTVWGRTPCICYITSKYELFSSAYPSSNLPNKCMTPQQKSQHTRFTSTSKPKLCSNFRCQKPRFIFVSAVRPGGARSPQGCRRFGPSGAARLARTPARTSLINAFPPNKIADLSLYYY